MHPSSFPLRQWPLLLLGAAPLLPIAALAALATHDLAGTRRESPATLGSLEVQAPAAGVAAPVGLVLTIHRSGD